ncbi:hypothetical protein DIE14_35310 [Burkholderia sp. Bp9017]|nr:hypothetical protein DIE14_35310 [Burkholderia sp. Bp9017]RQZ25603.1 hypothetical protein DIE13_31500 [Burkholderia sp. Bp9016]
MIGKYCIYEVELRTLHIQNLMGDCGFNTGGRECASNDRGSSKLCESFRRCFANLIRRQYKRLIKQWL